MVGKEIRIIWNFICKRSRLDGLYKRNIKFLGDRVDLLGFRRIRVLWIQEN
jgi:hypothetical protein